jgi:hypothetical protein
MDDGSQHEPTWRWWLGARLLWYNAGLLCAGPVAFVLYATVVFAFEDRTPDADINALTTILQAVGYLFAMGVANVCYLGGPLSELLLRPHNPARYRRVVFWSGFAFSALLPFAIPVALLCEVLSRS